MAFDPTPVLRLLAGRRARRLEQQDPAAAQLAQLKSLVARAAATKFGRDHGFDQVRTVADFQSRVPIRDFDALWNEYWQAAFPVLDDISWPGRIPFFARSSGTTTGRTKHLPITREIIKSNEGAGFDLMTAHLKHHPDSQPLAGRSFIIGGATRLEEASDGVFVGDVSGINTKLTPFWVRRRIFPPPALTGISDWDDKLEAVSEAVLQERVSMMSGMCNWMLMMLDRVREQRAEQGTLDGPTFPHLSLLIHGGVPIDLYRARLAVHLEGGHADVRELYPASEGFIAYADQGPGEGMRMMLDNGLFFEFVPLDELESTSPTRHWIGNVETGVDYALILSNNAGLWSYSIGDVVRFVETRPARLLIMGRVSQQLSPFGEHLISAEIDEAVRAAAREMSVDIVEYTVGPALPDGSGAGHHVYAVELDAGHMADGVVFASHVDRVLRQVNYDYDRKRTGNSGLAVPRIHWIAPGGFEAWMRSRGKMGGQNKVPRVTAKFDRFREMADQLDVPPELFEAASQ